MYVRIYLLSNVLAKTALVQHKTSAAIFKAGDVFLLQIAQPVAGRGVALFSQSINQLLGRFFQGRKDISAWSLKSQSGELLASSHQASDQGSTGYAGARDSGRLYSPAGG